ncbi:hypothetical protein VMCG_09730 [Cytospora schulzeri]|uniref:Rhodopsin domain-containing protein n=1 Tax=Cytospora schulzeri TaxID=448051 RepID=A0A423VH88_9PEZI|nr:hypothetical protein VMCG_09730 [Valsa malicola]
MSSVYDLLGKVDNLSDPQPALNSKSATYGLVISCLVISSLCVLGRIWVRVFVTRSFGWDDVFVVSTMLSNIIQAVGLCLTVNRGLGKHFILLGIEGMQDFIKTFYVANGAYPMSTTFIKLALLFQYLRIFNKGSKLRIVTVITIVVVCMWGFAFCFLAWVPCIPVRAYWNWLIPDSEATRYGYGTHNPTVFVATYIANAATNMILDLVTFAIPMPLWMDRSIQGRTRMALFGLFVLGAIVNICSVIRLVNIVQNRGGTYPTLDPSWYGCTAAMLSALEVNIATICASLPVFWPVIKEGLGRILVTYEVDVTHERRDSGDFNIMNESGELYSMRTMNSKGRQYAEDKYIRAQVDPLQQVKPTKTTVMSRARGHLHPENVGEGSRSLDLGSEIRAGLAEFELQRPGIEKRESKEGLLNE